MQRLVSAGRVGGVDGMGLGPGTGTGRRWRQCCSRRGRERVRLVGSEEMLQVRGRGGGRGRSRWHGICVIVSRSICSRRWVEPVLRLSRLGYSDRVRRSLHNLEVVIRSGCRTPANRHTELTNLAQLCHGLRQKLCRDSISKALWIIAASIKLICSHATNYTFRTISTVP
jgi:hypothetical protein